MRSEKVYKVEYNYVTFSMNFKTWDDFNLTYHISGSLKLSYLRKDKGKHISSGRSA